jgi:RNA polymerase sigma factor (sigma-70 family)
MQEKPDAQLLRAYVEGDESAFREIVSRHTDLVYSAALRQVNSQALAQDIAQSVFVDLVRKSREVSNRIAADASLAGWLYRSTRFAALNHLRDDRRRAEHERQAMEQLITDTSPTADWGRIRPMLDEAMAALSDDDRDALLLRYFKNHDFRTVGKALGLSDDAAQKRVSRAIERLREFFSKRGVAIGASGLVVLISANAVHAAPLALAGTISTAAVLAGTSLNASTAITATKAIAMTLLQKALVATTVTVLIGTSVYEAHHATQMRAQVQTLRSQQAPLAAQIQQLQQQRDEASNEVASLTAEAARAGHNDMELLKLRGEVGVLRQQQSQHPATAAQPIRTSQPAAENSPPSDDASQIAQAIAQGDPTALQRLSDYSKSQSQFFNTNKIGLTNEQLAALSEKSFGGLWAAFDYLAAESMKGNANARQAIDQSVRISYLNGSAADALGKLAANGDESALQTLLNYDKNGILLSSAVSALSGPANNGNEQAIDLLASVLKDPKKKPLWHMASLGLRNAAASGNQTAIDALKSMQQSQ